MNRLKEMWLNGADKLDEPRSKDDHVLIIDGLNTFIRVFSAIPALNDDGMHVGGVVGFLKSIAANIRQFQSTRCVVVFDGAGGSQRRRKLYPEYKSNRKNKTKMNRFDEFADIIDEQVSMRTQFKRLAEYFDLLPITVISIDNIEADDVIAYITKQYYENVDNKITIVSTDRDFLQLADERIRVWSPIKKKLYTGEKLSEEIGITSKNYLLYRTMSGDSSDNIPGVPGVGLPTLIKRFPQIIHEDCGIDEIILRSEQEVASGNKLKLYKTIAENRELLERNHKLMQLDTVDIAPHNKLNITELMDRAVNKLDVRAFKRLFMEDKLYSNIKDVDTWLRSTFKRLDVYE